MCNSSNFRTDVTAGLDPGYPGSAFARYLVHNTDDADADDADTNDTDTNDDCDADNNNHTITSDWQ